MNPTEHSDGPLFSRNCMKIFGISILLKLAKDIHEANCHLKARIRIVSNFKLILLFKMKNADTMNFFFISQLI